MSEPHEVLDVSPDADERTVRSAYRELLKEHHPDHGGSADRFIRIKEAYEAIVDDESSDGGLAAGVRGATGRPPTGRPRPTGRSADGQSVPTAQSTTGENEFELEASVAGLTVGLTALTDRLPPGALLPEHVEPGRRVAACFHVRNDAGVPVTWHARRVRFVDASGERHLPSVYRPKRRRLPDRWRGDDVDLEPGETADSFILSRTLPGAVTVEAVVYDQTPSVGPDRRMRFEIDDHARDALDRDPFR